MEQRDSQRFHRTSERELNNSKGMNWKTGTMLYTGKALPTHGQERKVEREGEIIEEQKSNFDVTKGQSPVEQREKTTGATGATGGLESYNRRGALQSED